MEEIWKPIPGFDNYEVTNLGKIYRVKSVTMFGITLKAVRIRRQYDHHTGYRCIVLLKDGKHCTKYVHRLVAGAFLPNPDNLPCINHKDENKQNNIVDNLEWCTYSYNSNYGTATERRVANHKPGNYSEVLQLDNDGNVIAVFNNTTEAGKAVGVDPSRIRKVLTGNGKYLRAGGYKWARAK